MGVIYIPCFAIIVCMVHIFHGVGQRIAYPDARQFQGLIVG